MSQTDQYAYDTFVSYTDADGDWVEDELLPRIASAGLSVCTGQQDFRAGATRIGEVERLIVTSRKTILVLTPDYLADEWAEYGSAMVHSLDPASRDRRLIPLIKVPCEPPLRIRHLIPVDFTESEDIDLNWQRLLKALDATSDAAPPAPPSSQPTTQIRQRDLRIILLERCSISDLSDLCYELQVDRENYPRNKQDFVRELLIDLEHKGKIDDMVAVLRDQMSWVLDD
jgi:hypothetical protein